MSSVSDPDPLRRPGTWTVTSGMISKPITGLTNSAGDLITGYKYALPEIKLQYSINIAELWQLPLFNVGGVNEGPYGIFQPEHVLFSGASASAASEMVGNSVLNYFKAQMSFVYRVDGFNENFKDVGMNEIKNGKKVKIVIEDAEGNSTYPSKPVPLNADGSANPGGSARTIQFVPYRKVSFLGLPTPPFTPPQP